MALFKIGKLAKLTDTSIKTLRFYDEIGVLIPCEIDKYSGYRYYDDKSVERVFLIKVLKDLGFSLNEIKNFNIKNLSKKAAELEVKIDEIKSHVTFLKNINKEEDLYMFVKKQMKADKKLVICACCNEVCACGCNGDANKCKCGK